MLTILDANIADMPSPGRGRKMGVDTLALRKVLENIKAGEVKSAPLDENIPAAKAVSNVRAKISGQARDLKLDVATAVAEDGKSILFALRDGSMGKKRGRPVTSA